MSLVLLVSSLLVSLIHGQTPEVIEGPGGKRYRFYKDQKRTNSNAVNECGAMGGILAIITSDEEYKFVKQELSKKVAWIGKPTAGPWDSGQDQGASCIRINKKGLYQNRECSQKNGFVCQLSGSNPPTPMPSMPPSPMPSPTPSTANPTPMPSIPPTPMPSPSPSMPPSPMPSPTPSTAHPTPMPSIPPTPMPSPVPSTLHPTPMPSIPPTPMPSPTPSTAHPTPSPSMPPSPMPSPTPTTAHPTPMPSMPPTPAPSPMPTTDCTTLTSATTCRALRPRCFWVKGSKTCSDVRFLPCDTYNSRQKCDTGFECAWAFSMSKCVSEAVIDCDEYKTKKTCNGNERCNWARKTKTCAEK